MKLAGKKHPVTGVPFTKDGYPDFSNYLYKGSKGKSEVKLEKFTSHPDDEMIANKLAGFKETPEGYTWHHKEDGTTMQLVEEFAHKKTGHTGGNAIYKKAVAFSAAMTTTVANAADDIMNTTSDDWLGFGGEILLGIFAPFTTTLEAPEVQQFPNVHLKIIKKEK